MYNLTEFEFTQFQIAAERLRVVKDEHAAELQSAYDNIHPTRTGIDYAAGRMYSESINPAQYAIYLIEMKEEHQRVENWWELRAAAYEKALSRLTAVEIRLLNSFQYGSYHEREKVRMKLFKALTDIVDKTPELRRKEIPLDEFEHAEAADRQIDAMSMDELLDGYYDLDEEITGERVKEQCWKLHEAGQTYAEIGRLLALETKRVKQYVNEVERLKQMENDD